MLREYSDTASGVSCGLGIEKPIRRARQPKIFSQRLPLIFATENLPPLQFRHDTIDEIIESARQIWKHDGESIGAFGDQPFLHLVGNGGRRSDHGEAGIAAETLSQFSHGEVLP